MAWDGNNNMLPIAVAYVEVEKYDSRGWFLSLLFRDIGAPNHNRWSFISNRQKGLLEAINELTPNYEHRFYVKHMYNNLKSKFSGLQLKNMFWKATLTYSKSTHYRCVKEIENLSKKKPEEETAYEWLSKIPAQHWARCFFPTDSKCDVIVNNLFESFNSYILPAKDLAIIDMFEWIRRRFMTRLQVKRIGMENYKENTCPNVVAKIEKQRIISRNCFPNWSGEDKYEVMHNLDNHLVYLKDGDCTCGFFPLCGFPCAHSIACIGYHHLNMEEYAHDFFKKKIYLKVYSHMINPVSGMHD